jgi:polar amino acid transport system substrate-binding protein
VTAENIGRKFGFASAESDAETVIRSSDAVVVATRHNDHAAYVLTALQRGKPVFVEKPMVITEQQLDDISTAVSKGAVSSIMVGFNRRFAPATRAVKDHFSRVAGPKQVLIRVNAGALPRDHWIHQLEVGGGRLVGEGCHFVDLVVALLGAKIKSVTAMAIRQQRNPPELWDDFSMVLGLEDGSIATVLYTAIGDTGLAKERIEVSGGSKSAVIDDFCRTELWSDGKRVHRKDSGQDKGQTHQIDAWVQAIRQGKSPIPFDEILNVHRACFAAIRSFRDGIVVQL